MHQIYNGMSAARLRDVTWRKSRHSNPSGNCVELARLPDGLIAMRDSRHPSGPVLIYTRAELDAFIRAAKNGDLDHLPS